MTTSTTTTPAAAGPGGGQATDPELLSVTKSHRAGDVPRHLRKLDAEWRGLPVTELKATLLAVVERITYHSASGEVSIRLHAGKEKRHA